MKRESRVLCKDVPFRIFEEIISLKNNLLCSLLHIEEPFFSIDMSGTGQMDKYLLSYVVYETEIWGSRHYAVRTLNLRQLVGGT